MADGGRPQRPLLPPLDRATPEAPPMETKCPLEPPPPETPSTSEPPAPETPRVVDPPPETPRAADEVESTGPHADLVAAVAVAAREGAREAVVAAISELQPVLVQALCEQLAREPRGRQRSSSIRGRERHHSDGAFLQVPRSAERHHSTATSVAVPRSADRHHSTATSVAVPRSAERHHSTASVASGRERRPSDDAVSVGACSFISADIGAVARQRFAAHRGMSDSCSERETSEFPVSKAASRVSAVSGKSLRFLIPARSEDDEEDSRPSIETGPFVATQLSLVSSSPRLSYSPPTVQSLQADIAQAVLHQGGIGLFPSRGTTGSSSSTWKRSVTGSSSGNLARVMPDLDDRAVASMFTVESASSAEKARSKGREEGADGQLSPVTQESESATSWFSASGLWPSTRRTELNRMSSSQVLKARCDELALQATHGSLPSFAPSEDGEEQEIRPVSSATGRLPRSVPTMMLVFGLLPWDLERRPCLSATLQWFCRAVIALSTAAFVLLSFGYVEGSGCRENGDGCWQQNGFLSQVPLPIGALMVLILTTLQRHQNALEETIALLLNVSFERRYQAWHSRQTLRDKAVFVAIWFCSFIAACIWNSLLGAQFENIAGRGVLHTIVMSILSAHILSFAYGIVHVCRSLTIMIDAFCCDVVHQDSARRVAHIWNMTQAILRKASVSVEHCLLGLCFVLVFSVPLLLIDVLHTANAPILTMIPTLCVTSGILYVLLLASTISEQCTRVPALVNALSFGEGTEAARQQTVDYISSSAAGFYVFGTRLTTATVLKLMYIWCIVVLGLLTRLSTS